MYRLLLLLLLIFFAIISTPGSAQDTAPQLEQRTMTADGIERTYWLYVPSTYTGDEAVPVVVALHGRFGTGESMERLIHLAAVAEEEGFLAVYPDGVNGEWKYFGGIIPDARLNTPDDTVFLNALLDDVAASFNVDAARAYLLGFSNGGFMTYRMMCEQPNRFAAFGVAGALLYPAMELPCLEAPVRPLIAEHGSADTNILWDGIRHQPVAGVPVVSRSVLESVSYFAGRNGCNVYGAQRTDLPATEPSSTVIRFEFGRCLTDQPVRFFAVINGGHTWPGGALLPEDLAGITNTDIDLTREMWAFFAEHPLTMFTP